MFLFSTFGSRPNEGIVHESWNSDSTLMKWIIFISFHSFCFCSLSKEISSDLFLSVWKHREPSFYIQEVKTQHKNILEYQNSDRSSCFRLWSSKSPNKPCSAKSNP